MDLSRKSDADLRVLYNNAVAKIGQPDWDVRARAMITEIEEEFARREGEISGLPPGEAADVRAEVAELDLAARVVRAFTRRPASEAERIAVRILHSHPNRTSRALTGLAGWRGEATWHLIFGTMCQKREPWLPQPPASWGRPGEAFYTGTLCDFDRSAHTFALKPAAVDGFRRVGLLGAGAGSGS